MSMGVKKLTGILFVLVMALGMLTLPGVRACAESNITIIGSAAEWDAFAQSVNKGTTYQGKDVILTSDITVSAMAGTRGACIFRQI